MRFRNVNEFAGAKGRIASPLTHRRPVAETFRYPINRSDRPVYLSRVLHHLLYAVGLATNCSWAAAQLSIETDSTGACPIKDSAAGRRGIHPFRTFCDC